MLTISSGLLVLCSALFRITEKEIGKRVISNFTGFVDSAVHARFIHPYAVPRGCQTGKETGQVCRFALLLESIHRFIFCQTEAKL
jgi:hypothetical protein